MPRSGNAGFQTTGFVTTRTIEKHVHYIHLNPVKKHLCD